MTIKEALEAKVGENVSENIILYALAKNNLDGNGQYSVDKEKDLGLATIEVLYSIVTVSSISEGDLSKSYNYPAIKDRLLYLADTCQVSWVTEALSPKVKHKALW